MTQQAYLCGRKCVVVGESDAATSNTMWVVMGSSHGVALRISFCGAGEYGHLLKDPTLREQFAQLQLRFPSATTEIKASLLSAYLKMQVTTAAG